MARRVVCYEIPIEFGDHTLYIISTDKVNLADAYIKRRFKITIEHGETKDPASYFAGASSQLFLYYPPGLSLDYLVHELVHVYQYIIKRLGTKLDDEGEAYLIQMLYKKTVEKLIEVNQVKITQTTNAIRG